MVSCVLYKHEWKGCLNGLVKKQFTEVPLTHGQQKGKQLEFSPYYLTLTL